MMRSIGITEKNEKVYSLSKEFGVDESGMIIKIDNEKDSFIFTKYYIDMEIEKDSSIEEMRSKVIDLRKVSIDGYILNLFDFELDGVPYIQMIKGSSEESELAERISQLPLKNQFFAKNSEAIVFIHIGDSSAIIKKDHRPKFHKDNKEEENKKLIAILKSISCQFGDKYENFEELKSSGQLDF
ncbi:MAG: hypothetical protein ACEQSQ_08995 [Candidatus Paceibacteria bacterium]